ncbi:MAG: hypothetical protein ACRCZI_14915 [Cetobacterium sp.]
MKRLLPDKLGMLYHSVLYDRMVSFAHEKTPEFPAEIAVNKWLNRFYSYDPLIHILIDCNDNGIIIGHAILEIQEAFNRRIVTCYQLQQDSNNTKVSQIDTAMEYLDKLKAEVQADCIMLVVDKNASLYKKRYGYNKSREVLLKYDSTTSE